MKLFAIKENHLYLKAYRKGQRYVGRYVAVYVIKDYAADRLMRENPEKKYLNRVGLSVTKKVGGAVKRSRAKRIIREGYRAVDSKTPLKRGWLIVISARAEIDGAKSFDLERDLRISFRKLGMLTDTEKKDK